jgi:hypothetical protein
MKRNRQGEGMTNIKRPVVATRFADTFKQAFVEESLKLLKILLFQNEQQVHQEASGFYSSVPNFTPTCFGKWLSSSGGRRCLINYSSSVRVVDVYGL